MCANAKVGGVGGDVGPHVHGEGLGAKGLVVGREGEELGVVHVRVRQVVL